VRPRRALPPAILLGGAVTTLSVARSLGSAGVEVVILSDDVTDCLGRHSRYCRRYVHFGPEAGVDVKDRWMDWIAGFDEPAVVLPCCDEGVELVARHRRTLIDAGHLPIEAADDVLLTMLDKTKTYRLAAAIGVVAPRMVTAHRPDDTSAALDEGLTFPCAVKPTRSDAAVRKLPGYKSSKGTVVHDDAELAAAVGILFSVDVGALITEIIPGGDDRFCSYYTYLDEEGEPLLHFTKRKPRQFPIAFGTGTYHVTKWQPDVAELGLRFFQGVGLRGLGNVEFKRDERDGQLKLIECNPRFTMANGLARLAGIDFALLAYNRLVGRGLPPLESFRDDVSLWFPREDLRALRAYRASGELSTTEWLRTVAHVQHFPTFAWSDPKPWLAGVRAGLRRMGAGARRPAVPSPAAPAVPSPAAPAVPSGDDRGGPAATSTP